MIESLSKQQLESFKEAGSIVAEEFSAMYKSLCDDFPERVVLTFLVGSLIAAFHVAKFKREDLYSLIELSFDHLDSKIEKP